MSRDTLFVSPHQSQWEVHSDEAQGDSDFPRYDSKEEAVDAAILSAQNSSKRGREGHVYVRDAEEAQFRLERSIAPESD